MSTRQLAAIMFTDIAGYTALMGADEEQALETLRKSRNIQKSAIENHNGKWLKEMGDGVLVQFRSALDAVRCALEIQQKAHEDLNAKIRIGIHLGDVTIENNDVFGDGVNIASRLQAIADPGGIYVSESIHQAVHAFANIKMRYLADLNLKNVNRPVRTYFLIGDLLPVPTKSKIKTFVSPVRRKLSYPLIGLIVFVLIVIGWLLSDWQNDKMSSIAVLPIGNLSGDSSNNILMVGIHSELRDQIAAMKYLRVPSRTSTSKYQNSNKSVPEIARELGVDMILEPDIYEIGDSLRIQVRLIRAFPEERQLWSASFVSDLGNVLSIYNKIANAVAKEMNISESIEDISPYANTFRVDPDAYKAYIEGLGYLYKTTPDGFDLALKYFNQSLEKDPDYAAAYTGIALVWGFRMQMGIVSTSEAAPQVGEATSKALSLGSTQPEIHYLLAVTNTWGYWKWGEADKEFKKILELDPNHSEARAYYAHYLNIMQQSKEASIQMENALQLETENWLVQALYGMYLNHTRQFDKAVTRLKKILEADPGNPIALAALWTIYHNMGRFEEAIETAKVLYTERREYRAVEKLITGSQEGGYKAAMEQVAEVFIEKMDTTFFTPWQIATLYTRADNREKAIIWLEKAYEARDANMPYISCDPIFDRIADHPGFQDILAKMRLTRRQGKE